MSIRLTGLYTLQGPISGGGVICLQHRPHPPTPNLPWIASLISTSACPPSSAPPSLSTRSCCCCCLSLSAPLSRLLLLRYASSSQLYSSSASVPFYPFHFIIFYFIYDDFSNLFTPNGIFLIFLIH